MLEEEAAEAIEEKIIEECLRKKAADVKKKTIVAPSAQLVSNPSKDVYLSAFYVGAPFEMLRDLAQLEAW